MVVEFHPEARTEMRDLRQRAPAEYKAMRTAIAKLEVLGPALPYPHSSQVKGTPLRELRPRQGRSAWRLFYWQVGDTMRVGALGPEAKSDPRGFRTAVDSAVRRLSEES